MSDWEPTVGVPVVFRRSGSSGTQEIVFTRFLDGSAYIEGAEEIIFEQSDKVWKEALQYLKQNGYVRQTTESDGLE